MKVFCLESSLYKYLCHFIVKYFTLVMQGDSNRPYRLAYKIY